MPMNTDPIADEYEAWLASWSPSRRTINARTALARNRLRAWGTDGFTTSAIQTWLGTSNLSAWSRATYYAHLRDFCAWAVATGYLPADPMEDVRKPKRPRSVPRPLTEAEVDKVLADPWAFRAEVDAVAVEDAKPQRYALLHLFYPDTFEAIVSPPHRERIVSYFAGHGAIEPTGDDDRDLLAIRAAITPQYGEGFDFYASRLRPLWEQGSDPWAPVVLRDAAPVRLWRERFDYVLVLNADLADESGPLPPVPGLEPLADEGFARLVHGA